MAEYTVVFARSARRELERLQAQMARRIVARIETLASNPRPPGCMKLQGADNLWRIRVGEYRLIYSINDSARLVDISAVRHRSDAYR
ncbi:MAG: type II toxin-antitoxin system RelE family toxin [Candidatus Rokuibacteriota bacterium]